MVPSNEERKYLYKISGIDYKKYRRSVDGIILKNSNLSGVKSIDDFLFVEIKATRKKSVKQLPYGVFFGLTKNEEDLFKKLKNYRLCIAHIDLDEYILITYDEYLKLISNKRVQYQINFKKQ